MYTSWIVYPENAGAYLSIDEVDLSHGELYKIVTNKKFKTKKDPLVAIVSITKVNQVI